MLKLYPGLLNDTVMSNIGTLGNKKGNLAFFMFLLRKYSGYSLRLGVFYSAPGSNVQGHDILSLKVCLFVCRLELVLSLLIYTTYIDYQGIHLTP